MRSRKALSDPGLRVFWRLPAFNSAAARAAAAFRERLDRGELFLGISRRSFVSRAFSLGGFAAGYAALQGLGLTSSAAAQETPNLPRDFGKGRSVLGQPQGRVFLSGAHLSQLPSWQEGGVAAARRTVGLIADHVRADRLTPAHS
jgi:hypothetical protein